MTVFRRNFAAYFGSPTGYVFITIFVVAGAYLAFSTAGFFAVNLADLSSLNALFHWLLILFIPAISMGAWADEQRLGTDELLFTLPLRDVEIVVGKYLAALGVYTVALVFALSHALILAWLGDPDWGLITANFIGYWVIGAALITVGLVASALTGHVTVAFILGTAFCLVLVFAEDVLAVIPGIDRTLAERVGVLAHFRNFTLGVISLTDLLYFAMLSVVMLYINLVLIGRRHWRWGGGGREMGWQYLARTVCVIVTALSLSILGGRWLDWVRLDVTAAQLNTISDETVSLLEGLPDDQPVYIQAFISPEVPRDYVATRRDLLRVLREFDALAGDAVVVSVRDTELYSEEARTAEERFDIRPTPVAEMSEGRIGERKVFMGVAVISGAQQEVIGFFEPGLSVEYELARSVRVVAKAARRKIGVLKTDAKLFGGFEMSVMQAIPSWAFVDELKKQYDVREVEAGVEIPEDIDVLIAALPSSLTQEQMDRLADYLESGRPALLFVDPAPMVFPMLSPSRPKPPPRGRFAQQAGMQQKGDIDRLLGKMGLMWTKDAIVWHAYNPLTKLRDLPPEVVFAGAGAGGVLPPFDAKTVVSRDLEMLVFLFPGALRPAPGTPLKITPLVRTGSVTGELGWEEVFEPGFFGMGIQVKQNRVYRTRGQQYVLAAHVTGTLPIEEAPAADEPEAKKEGAPRPRSINAIVVADLDMISETFFALRKRGDREMRFDNVPFILNCVDYLAGDESLIALRNRRPKYRALSRIEAWRKEFRKEKQTEEEEAEKQAEKELKEAQARLDRKVKDLKDRTDVDAKTKSIMLYNLQQVEEKRLERIKGEIETEKNQLVEAAELRMRRAVRDIEGVVRFWAVVLPPLPAIIIGILVFLRLWHAERAGTPLGRSMRRAE